MRKPKDQKKCDVSRPQTTPQHGQTTLHHNTRPSLAMASAHRASSDVPESAASVLLAELQAEPPAEPPGGPDMVHQ